MLVSLPPVGLDIGSPHICTRMTAAQDMWFWKQPRHPAEDFTVLYETYKVFLSVATKSR